MNGSPTRLEHDWFPGLIPANVRAERDVYLDTSYGFAMFSSELDPGLEMEEASGAYDRATFLIGPEGRVSVGSYTCLNGTYIVCNERIQIGSHCFTGWGSVITDTWQGTGNTLRARRAALHAASADPRRRFPSAGCPRPVVVENNVWIGFDSVILPGVTLGTGCIVGCKTVIGEDVPPYAVVGGNPPRVIRYLDPVEWCPSGKVAGLSATVPRSDKTQWPANSGRER